MDPLVGDAGGVGYNPGRLLTARDLQDLLSSAGADYELDPIAAAAEVIFTCPAGYYAIVTHYSAGVAVGAAGLAYLALYVRDVGGVDYMIEAASELYGAAATLYFRLQNYIVLDEGQQLYRDAVATPGAGAALRVIMIQKSSGEVKRT